MPQSSTSVSGFLSSTDWNTFNNKQAALGYTAVNRAGDSMTGTLNLASNGLSVGTDQLVLSGGNVGVGTTNPTAKLTIQGAAVSRTNIISTGGSVDLALSNQHLLKAPGGSSLTLSNPADGGVYTLIVSDTTARVYTFSGCTNQYFSPANDMTVGQTTYTILVVVDGVNTNCYITWTTGFI
jgi:hypothetical protein